MNLNKLIQLALENEGASLSLNSGIFNPKVGFFASYKVNEIVIPKDALNKESLLTYISLNEAELRTNGNFIGVWIEADLVYLDVSRQFANECDCKEFAIANKQLAYYDAKNEIVKTIRRRI